MPACKGIRFHFGRDSLTPTGQPEKKLGKYENNIVPRHPVRDAADTRIPMSDQLLEALRQWAHTITAAAQEATPDHYGQLHRAMCDLHDAINQEQIDKPSTGS